MNSPIIKSQKLNLHFSFSDQSHSSLSFTKEGVYNLLFWNNSPSETLYWQTSSSVCTHSSISTIEIHWSLVQCLPSFSLNLASVASGNYFSFLLKPLSASWPYFVVCTSGRHRQCCFNECTIVDILHTIWEMSWNTLSLCFVSFVS